PGPQRVLRQQVGGVVPERGYQQHAGRHQGGEQPRPYRPPQLGAGPGGGQRAGRQGGAVVGVGRSAARRVGHGGRVLSQVGGEWAGHGRSYSRPSATAWLTQGMTSSSMVSRSVVARNPSN